MRHHKLTPHQVIQSHSEVYGCEPILYSGKYDACVNYIRNLKDSEYELLTAGDHNLDIVNLDTMRLVSYVI